MHKIGMFDRKGALVQEGFSGSGLIGWTDTSPISMTERQS